MPVFNNMLAGASGAGAGYEIERSLRFNDADQSNLSRTPSAAGNRKTFTWNAWTKRSELGGTQRLMFVGPGSNYFSISFNNDQIQVEEAGGSNSFYVYTNAVFRDPSSWYQVVIAVDTTQATQTNRVKVYVNGTEQSLTAGNNWPPQNADLQINNTVDHRIGRNDADCFNGFLADVHFIDGQALAPTDFGETDDNGVWQPKAYTGNYNISNITYSNYLSAPGGFASGEGATNAFDGSTSTRTKVAVADSIITFDLSSLNLTGSFEFYATNAASEYSLDGGTTWTSSAANSYTTATSDISGVSNIKLKSASGTTMKVTAFKNQGFVLVDNSGTNSFHLPFSDNSSNAALGTDTSGNSNNFTVNNLSAGAASNLTAKQNFDVVTYTGNGSTQSISSLAFQPDFVWIKARNAGYNHVLFDSVRGTGGAKVLFSNDTSAEGGSSGQEGTVYGHVSAFNSNGFTVAAGTGTPLWVSNSGTNYIAWCWKAGGAASSNTDGTITSSVSANASNGFSVVSWTGNSTAGATIGHGLSTAPKMIIVKNRSRGTYGDWVIGHDAINGFQDGNQLYFTSAAVASGEGFFNNTSPTSSVFTVKNNYQVNYSGDNYVAYVWSEVAGFSKFGSYSGNGSTTGPIITTGFKPRFLLIKRTDAVTNWRLFDTKRDPSNPADTLLFPDSAEVEATSSTYNTDLLSDGFQLKNTHDGLNASGGTYIYAAFAATVPADPDSDSLVDTPTNAATPTDTGAGGEVVGNYATLNPLATYTGTLSNGNLKFSTSGGWEPTSATIGVSSGKWYWEYLFEGTNSECGITAHPSNTGYTGNYQGSLGIGNLGDMYYNGASSTPFSSFASGSIIGMELDLDNGTFRHYVNGVAQSYATQSLDTSLTWFPSGSVYGSSHLTYNFGQRAFAYTAPSGYKALCTSNLPEPTIADGSLYFDTKLYTGNASSKAITGYNFSPDFVWIKNRSGAYHHGLFDIVRGANKVLLSSGTNAETTYTQQLNSFDSSGFTLGDNSDSGNYVNVNNSTYVGWAWDAGSSNTTIAAGSLNSSTYDQSQTWSTYGTFTGTVHNDYDWLGVFGASDVWDGLGSLYLTSNSGKWTLSSPIACSSGVKFYVHGNYSITINEGLSDEITQSSTGGANYHYFTIPFSGNIASIKSNTSYAYLMRIFVDGLALIDSGISINTPSIASTVRANPSAGFSIVTWTGNGSSNQSVGHNLNAAPKLVIFKRYTGGTSNWQVYHESIGNTQRLALNTTDAAISAGTLWGNGMTSSVLGIGPGSGVNTSGSDYVAYCFTPVEGYSAMGSYTGNGNADGVFVHTGFKIAWLMVKKTSSSGTGWRIFDNQRSPENAVQRSIESNLSNAETNVGPHAFDFLSNGFKFRTNDTGQNASGQTYIYLAFAENPFKNARAR